MLDGTGGRIVKGFLRYLGGWCLALFGLLVILFGLYLPGVSFLLLGAATLYMTWPKRKPQPPEPAAHN